MGLFDSLKKSAEFAIKKEAASAVQNAASAIGKGRNHSETFTFNALPTSLQELQQMPEASMDSALIWNREICPEMLCLADDWAESIKDS